MYPWQAKQWQQMVSVIEQKRVPHALLLTAKNGSGAEDFAFSVAQRLLCIQPGDNGQTCGQCKSCQLLNVGNHPDLKLINPEEEGKQIKVDAIRDLVAFIQLSSQYEQYKICIIDPADAMNRSSANGLLKTLEEPPSQSVIILITSDLFRIPITLRSRCQEINLDASVTPETTQWISEQTQGSDYSASELLDMAQGGPLAAVDIYNSGQYGSHEAILNDLKQLSHQGLDPVQIAQKWQSLGTALVFKLLMLSFNKMSRLKLPISHQHNEKSSIIGYLQELSNELDLNHIVSCYDLALKNYNAAVGPISLNQQGLLEDMIIYWQSLHQQKRRTS